MSAEMINIVPEPEPTESFVMNLAVEDSAPEQLSGGGVTGDPVKDYLKAISKTPLLDAQKEVELAKAIEAGLVSEQLLTERKTNAQGAVGEMVAKFAGATDEELMWLVEAGQDAKLQMQEANLRLVVSIAKKYTGRGMEFLDIIQEGNKGLYHAVEKFDYAKGYKFSTYSTWWIRQAITRSMAELTRTIRLPVHMVEKINQMTRVERQMLRDLGREPTPAELAKELETTEEKIVGYKKYAQNTVSLDTPLGDGGGSGRGQSESYLKDVIEDTTLARPDEVAEYSVLQKAILHMLDTLDEREAGVMTMRYGLDGNPPRTLDDVGKVYGVTRERIRQIEAKTLSKLRHPSRSGHLRDYLK